MFFCLFHVQWIQQMVICDYYIQSLIPFQCSFKNTFHMRLFTFLFCAKSFQWKPVCHLLSVCTVVKINQHTKKPSQRRISFANIQRAYAYYQEEGLGINSPYIAGKRGRDIQNSFATCKSMLVVIVGEAIAPSNLVRNALRQVLYNIVQCTYE